LAFVKAKAVSKAQLKGAFVAWLSEQAESTEDKFQPFSSTKAQFRSDFFCKMQL